MGGGRTGGGNGGNNCRGKLVGSGLRACRGARRVAGFGNFRALQSGGNFRLAGSSVSPIPLHGQHAEMCDLCATALRPGVGESSAF